MTITETRGSLGSFGLMLSEDTPDFIVNALGFFGHVVVVDGPAPVEQVADGLLARARYVGVLRQRGKTTGGKVTLGGSGMVYWLGDEDNKGPVIEAALTFTNATLATVLGQLLALAPAVSLGTVYPLGNPAARYTGTHQWQTVRQALDVVCDAFGIEYRVNGDASVDFGTEAQLYVTTPRSIVVRREPGADMDVVGLGADYAVDAGTLDYSSRVVLLGQTTDAGQFATGSQSAPSNPYKDMRGNPVKVTRLISESDQTVGSVASRTQLQLNRYNRVARSLDVTAEDYETSGAFRVGDYTWVFDPDTGVVNPANEVTYRGEVLHPDAVRVLSATWPLVEGYTVAFRTDGGVWYDLTRFVTYETGTDQLTVGDLPTSLSRPTDDPIALRVDASRGQIPPDTTVPDVPGSFTVTTSSLSDSRGNYQALIDATWSQPLNTDATVMTDLDYYVFRYRPVGRPNWAQSFADVPSIEVPAILNTDYEAQVAAVDTAGHTGAYSASQTVHTSIDVVAPPPPADPTVASYLGQLRIEYGGRDNTSAAMPPDTDYVRVEVAPADSGPWTTASFGQLNPFIKGVAYADAPYGVQRSVRLIAVDRAGNESTPSGIVHGTTVKVADGDVASLSIGKLTAGTLLVDIVNAGRLMSGTVGQRYELNAAGLQMWRADGTKTVDLNGATNLIMGLYQTDLPGNRRVQIGAAGAQGWVEFYAPDGTHSYLRSYTLSSGLEGIQTQMPVTGVTNGLWNSVLVQENEAIALISKQVQVVITNGIADLFAVRVSTAGSNLAGAFGDTSNSMFQVSRLGLLASNINGVSAWNINGSATSAQSTVWPSPTKGTARFDFVPNPFSDNNYSPSMQFVSETNIGARIRLAAAVGAFEFVNPAENGFVNVNAQACNSVSDSRTKENVVALPDDPLAIVRSHEIVTFQRKGGAKKKHKPMTGKERTALLQAGEELPEPFDPEASGITEVGVRAEDAHSLIRRVSGGPEALQMVDLGSAVFTGWAAIQRLAERLEALEKKGKS